MNAVDELNFLLGIGPPRPQLPLTLQRSGYTSVRALGKGSFGQAFLVFHKERNQYYVVKHVNMTNMTSRQRKDAHNEISVLQQLHHPNIVRYVEYFEEHPHLYIVMEYADGGDLFTHLTKISRLAGPSLLRQGLQANHPHAGGAASGLLTEPQVISLFVQTAMAVKFMHDRRLLHRDIKSQNVFLTRNHVVKLGDFGITTVLQNTVAMASTMCGTPCYFSPELCQGQPYNNKSDVWALGVLLYELCAGTLPFESTTMKALMREIVNKQPRRIPPCFSDELWKLIQWMLEKNPKKRPDAGQVLMQPVLMRRVPDIIEQLKSAQFNDISPRAGAKSAAASPQKSGAAASSRLSPNNGGGGTPAEAGAPENIYVADTEPYRELLAQQQRQQQSEGNPHRSGAAGGAGSNPFSGAVPPGNAGGGYTSGLGVRPSPPSAQKNLGKEKEELTPGQRAAKDVLLQKNNPPPPSNNHVVAGQKNAGSAGNHDKAEAVAAPPAKPPSSPSAAGANRRPISELLAKFDAEKKRIAEGKNSAASSQRASAGPNVPPRLPPKLSDAAVAEARAAADKKQGHGDASLQPSALRAKNNKDLGDMLNEMTGHFELFASARMAKDGEVIALPGPPPVAARANPAAPRRHTSAEDVKATARAAGKPSSAGEHNARAAVAVSEAEAVHDFADPNGARLDVASLQQQQQQQPPPLSRASPPPPSSPASQSSGANLNGTHMSAEKLFSTSLNKKFDKSAKAKLPSGALGEILRKLNQAEKTHSTKQSPQVSPKAASEGAKNSNEGKSEGTNAEVKHDVDGDAHEDDISFLGKCLCGGNTLAGSLSLVYGSFLCPCEGCAKLNGYTCVTDNAGDGIEWLHLPNVTDFAELHHVMAPPVATHAAPAKHGVASSTPSGDKVPVAVGGGASAATALKGAATTAGKDTAPHSASGARSFTFTALISDSLTDVAEDTDREESPAASANGTHEETFEKFFCVCCGGLLAVRHGGLEGLLVPKAFLSAESQSLLDQFAMTVFP